MKRNSVVAPKQDRAALEALADAALETDVAKRWPRLEQALDVDRFVDFMAMEVMVGHRDGYCLARNNYRVYHDLDSEQNGLLSARRMDPTVRQSGRNVVAAHDRSGCKGGDGYAGRRERGNTGRALHLCSQMFSACSCFKGGWIKLSLASALPLLTLSLRACGTKPLI